MQLLGRGHEAYKCRNLSNLDFRVDKKLQACRQHCFHECPNASHWLIDTGATDNFTNDLELLHMH
jgi:hypothetical protein